LKKDLFTFSTQEAETLGIECAIVLAATKDLTTSSSTPNEIARSLKQKIPFLEEQEILTHLKRLIDLKLVLSEIDSQIEKPSAKKNLYKLKLPGINSSSGKRKLDYSWVPSIQAFEVLGMGNINKEFIESKVNEFKMYWLEKNQVRDNWNVLFVDFIRREWVKENSENKGLPVCIDKNWSPSSDAFDILELANVSKNDALKHLKEFILYWKENGTALRSWNSKFVDFVKRKELIGSYEEKDDKKTNRHNEPGEFSQKFKERTKDDSWAENLEL
tara:strand:+ start:11274 stop:12092 length:819 start_codon:yes stop_codon:yes gene_type:complete